MTVHQTRTPAAALADPALAVNGGPRTIEAELGRPPAFDMEPAIAAIADTLRREGTLFVWYGGPQQRAFEAEFAAWAGTRHAVLCSSGSAALTMCLHSLGVDHDSVVGVPTFAFYSCVTTVMQLGARVRLLPVDADSLVITAQSCGDRLDGCSVLLAVHTLGHAVDIGSFRALRPDLTIIEDAAEAQGTTLRGRQVGTDGAAACWSLTTAHNELHAAGVAGVVTTDDPAIAARCRRLAHYGKDHRSVVRGTGLNPRPTEPGFNFMSNEGEAAVARAALCAFDATSAHRRAIGELLTSRLADRGLWTLTPPQDSEPNHYDVVFGLDDDWAPHRESVLQAMLAEGAPAWTYHSLAGLSWLKAWLRERGCWDGEEDAIQLRDRRLVDRLIAFKPSLLERDIDRVLACVDKVLGT